MDIHQATKSYEDWMRQSMPVIDSQLRSKHRKMRLDPFQFFRGTYYRWAQLWPELCPDLLGSSKVLCVGDLHVGSFGTWRDVEGRLCWGVDDFDESYPLPYTNDLVRLATSVKLLIQTGDLTIKLKDACDAFADGYQQTLKQGGSPIVLAENNDHMERLGIKAIKPPPDFWKRLNIRPSVGSNLPPGARRALEKMLPEAKLDYKVVRREAGMGSMGQERFVAISRWRGGCIAREAKRMLPAASVWLDGAVAHCQLYYQTAITSAVRCPDPYQGIVGPWLVRRLSPDSNPIDIGALPKERDEDVLLHAMGSEIANVHLGSRRQVQRILKDLSRKKSKWLRAAAKVMAKTVVREWAEYKNANR